MSYLFSASKKQSVGDASAMMIEWKLIFLSSSAWTLAVDDKVISRNSTEQQLPAFSQLWPARGPILIAFLFGKGWQQMPVCVGPAQMFRDVWSNMTLSAFGLPPTRMKNSIAIGIKCGCVIN